MTSAREGGMPLLVIVTGPTASGKTDLAIDIARRLGTGIVSADSRQIYKGMPVATAAPTQAQLQLAPHFMVGILDVHQSFSAGDYGRQAAAVVNSLFEKHGSAVVCGGSMLYIDALTHGLGSMPHISPQTRQKVADMLQTTPHDVLWQRVAGHDPRYFAEADRNNPRRLARALEMIESGANFTNCRTDKSTPLAQCRTVRLAIDRPRQQLFERINARVQQMVADGIEDEARRLYPLRGLNSLETVGLSEWFDHFDALAGKYRPINLPKNVSAAELYPLDRAAVIARIAKNTRVYAKKQLLWMRRYDGLQLLKPGQTPCL